MALPKPMILPPATLVVLTQASTEYTVGFGNEPFDETNPDVRLKLTAVLVVPVMAPAAPLVEVPW